MPPMPIKLSMVPIDVTMRTAKRTKPHRPAILPAHSSPSGTDLRVTHAIEFHHTKTRADTAGMKWPWSTMNPGDAVVLTAPHVIGSFALKVSRAYQRPDGSIRIKAKCIHTSIKHMRTYVIWCEDTGYKFNPPTY